MFGIGGFELFIILLFGFLLFGPDKLPSMARTIGRGIAKFRAAQQEMSDVIKESNAFNPNDEEPFKDPTETIDKLASTAEKHLRSAGSSVKSSIKEKTHDEKSAASASAPATATAHAAKTLLDLTAEQERAAEQAASASSATSGNAAPNAAAPKDSTAAEASVPTVKSESFTERKARYERERAARLAAQQQADAESSEQGGER